MKSDKETHPKPVPASEYDDAWIADTWGWDDGEEFIRTGGGHIRPRVEKALKMARIKEGMRILDVGCGRGEVVLHCARKGITSVGIDYSPDAIALAEKARSNTTGEVMARATFILGDVNAMPDSAGTFDRILLLDIVEHLHDYELVPLLSKLKTMLSPGGSIVIHTLPNRWVYDFTYARLMRIVMPWLPGNPRSAKEQSIHVNEMSIVHLDRLLRNCGLNCRLYLREVITAQAAWHRRSDLKGTRGTVYRWFGNPLIAWSYRLLALTPLRLLVVNDIFCIAQDRSAPWQFRGWGNLTETIACRIARAFEKGPSPAREAGRPGGDSDGEGGPA